MFRFFPAICFLTAFTVIIHTPHTAYSADADYPRDRLVCFPYLSIMAEGNRFRRNDVNYSFLTRREIDIDVLRYNKSVMSFQMDERNFFNGERNSWHQPYRVQYYIGFTDLRYEFEKGNLSCFVDHLCNNIVNQKNTDPLQLGWYRYGIKWETPGWRTGDKDRRIRFDSASPFEFLGQVDYSLSAGKTIINDFGYYKAILITSARVDLFRYYRMVAYMEGSLFSVFDWKYFCDPSIETGLRFHFQNVNVTPFVKYSYQHCVNYYNGLKTDFLQAGVRMECRYRSDDSTEHHAEVESSENAVDSIALHGTFEYGRYLSDKALKWGTDVTMTADMPRISCFNMYLSTNLSHESIPGENPWPRYIAYAIEPGISVFSDPLQTVTELYWRRTDRNETNEYRGYDENFDLIGFRIESTGTRIGYANTGPADKQNGIRAGNVLLNWRIGSGYVARNENFKYRFISEASVKCDYLGFGKYIPYVRGGLKVYSGNKYTNRDEWYANNSYIRHDRIYEKRNLWSPEFEAGVRIPGTVGFTLFFREKKAVNIQRVGGLHYWQHFVGLRIDV